MGNVQQEPTPAPAPQPVAMPGEPKSNKVLSVVLGIIILAVIVLAAFYIYGLSISNDEAPATTGNGQANARASADASLGSIDRDLDSMDVENSDREAGGIDESF